MGKYYDEKIEMLYKKYIELFKDILLAKKVDNINNNIFLSQLAYDVLQYYPKLQIQINRVVYIFTEEENSEEKLDSLLNLYKVISEEIYGKFSCKKTN